MVFILSDRDKDEFEKYFSSMVTSKGDQFLALNYDRRDFKTELMEVFGVDGIPSLVLLKPDGTIITTDGRGMMAQHSISSFPWDPASCLKAKNDAIQKEKGDEEAQRDAGDVVMKRIRGVTGSSIKHCIDDKTISFQAFSTVGAPGLLTDTGVLYFELEILSIEDNPAPQFGFALVDGIDNTDEYNGEGVGNNEKL